MAEIFHTLAEQKAVQAEELRAFNGIKLQYIRTKIEAILSLIGRNNIFDQYTRHDIDHINEMLNIVGWIIPTKTQECLTSAEWLMLVLSIYFHDMGMLVTKKEYDNRNKNIEFRKYKDDVSKGIMGQEYKEKLLQLSVNDSEHFLYQEFVRGRHSLRIKQWILGENGDLLDEEGNGIIAEINEMLVHIDPKFKRDLAIICESHHLDDLDDFEKYQTSSRYGNTESEVVNLQYIAVILRTADLLHITSDRTPSIQFVLVNPSDPKSLIEWQKQMAVKAVQPKVPRNKDGEKDESLPKDTIEITAYFDKPDQAEAFFGLSSYIMYMKKELQKNFEWVQLSMRKEGTKNYLYPWQKIDDEKIETLGFEPHQLQFTVDQSSILQLLVGHTLYEDSSVVIRELVQNGIDAVKLQYCLTNGTREVSDYITSGEVHISWKEGERCLSISDNGTGMEIEEVINFLLKVGASKYRSAQFQKEYPNFSAISRFGIGVLTCFLIADDIDITTNSQNEKTANVISLRKVNGKYLLKKVDKASVNSFIREHGTEITLHVRTDVNVQDILASARKWIVFPRCKVVLINGSESISIGYQTPKEALEQYITENSYSLGDDSIKVEEVSKNGIYLAYALQYNKYFGEWNFLRYGQSFYSKDEVFSPIGICVEGVRVEFNSPGFDGINIIAVANTKNCSSVLTNVARSAVEENSQKEIFLAVLYQFYAQHLQSQIISLQNKGFSINWATSECKYLMQSIIPSSYDSDRNKIIPQSFNALHRELDKINCIVIEADDERKAMSAKDIADMDSINIVDSEMVTAAESLLRQVRSDTTLSQLITTVQPQINLPTEAPLLCNYDSGYLLHQHALQGKEVSSIVVIKEQRRVDLYFSKGCSNWVSFTSQSDMRERHFPGDIISSRQIHIPISEIQIQGLSDEFGVKTINGIYLSNRSPLTQYICSLLLKFDYEKTKEDEKLVETLVSIICNDMFLEATTDERTQTRMNEFFNNMVETRMNIPTSITSRLWERIDKTELCSKLFQAKYILYRPRDWSRNKTSENVYYYW